MSMLNDSCTFETHPIWSSQALPHYRQLLTRMLHTADAYVLCQPRPGDLLLAEPF